MTQDRSGENSPFLGDRHNHPNAADADVRDRTGEEQEGRVNNVFLAVAMIGKMIEQ